MFILYITHLPNQRKGHQKISIINIIKIKKNTKKETKKNKNKKVKGRFTVFNIISLFTRRKIITNISTYIMSLLSTASIKILQENTVYQHNHIYLQTNFFCHSKITTIYLLAFINKAYTEKHKNATFRHIIIVTNNLTSNSFSSL